ncbi:transposase [Nitrosomonas communis]|uniref:transposase n=1 Tax=Nitrosomonas communis TaxID=44574 RepID=UPI003D268D7A
MEESKKRRHYSEDYKKEAVLLVTEQGYSLAQAAQAVGTSEKNLQRWVKQQAQESSRERLNMNELAELDQLRREVKMLRMEKEILKKASGTEAKEMK